jgi:hypothetical protein
LPNKDCHALDHAKERPVKNRLGAKRFLNSAKLTQQILDGFTCFNHSRVKVLAAACRLGRVVAYQQAPAAGSRQAPEADCQLDLGAGYGPVPAVAFQQIPAVAFQPGLPAETILCVTRRQANA